MIVYEVLRSLKEIFAGASKVIQISVPYSDLTVTLKKITKEVHQNRYSLEEKIQEANKALLQTSKVIQELEQELQKNVTNLNIAKEEYEKFSQLAQLKEGEAKAVATQIASSLDSGKWNERWFNIAVGFGFGLFFFILGIIATLFFL